MSNKLTLTVLFLGASLPSLALAQSGSIWPNSGAPGSNTTLYGDQVAASVGDLITIVVNLSAVATRDQSTDTSKAASVADTITALGYPETGGWPDWYRYRNQAPQMGWNAAQSYKGAGKMSNTEVFTTTIAARVVDALPNGVLRIEARRRSETGKEKSDLILTGLVRRQDLSTGNSVSSNQIADLQIKQEGTGPLSRNTRKGWLTTFYEFINPF
jgi:flagellar L-ring protein FlgH